MYAFSSPSSPPFSWPWLVDAVQAQGPDAARPAVRLDVQPGKPEVGEEVAVSWQVTDGVSVSVRRDGQQVSTDPAGEMAFTVSDKQPITWAVVASNRAGATSEEITVRPVTFGPIASCITSGMEAAGGLWAGQLLIAIVPGVVIILVSVVKGQVNALGGTPPATARDSLYGLPAGPAGRRASILWPGLSLAARLVFPLLLAFGPIDGHQADDLGKPPPGPGRRPVDHLVFRFGHINDDAIVSLFDCHTQTAVLFVLILARGGTIGRGGNASNSLSIHIICFYWQRPCTTCTSGGRF